MRFGPIQFRAEYSLPYPRKYVEMSIAERRNHNTTVANLNQTFIGQRTGFTTKAACEKAIAKQKYPKAWKVTEYSNISF